MSSDDIGPSAFCPVFCRSSGLIVMLIRMAELKNTKDIFPYHYENYLSFQIIKVGSTVNQAEVTAPFCKWSLQTEMMYVYAYRAGKWDPIRISHLKHMWKHILMPGVKWRTCAVHLCSDHPRRMLMPSLDSLFFLCLSLSLSASLSLSFSHCLSVSLSLSLFLSVPHPSSLSECDMRHALWMFRRTHRDLQTYSHICTRTHIHWEGVRARECEKETERDRKRKSEN